MDTFSNTTIPDESTSIVVGPLLRAELHRELQRMEHERTTTFSPFRKNTLDWWIEAIQNILGEGDND